MLFVRMYKSSDNNRVNMSEFRYILVKFGVILPMSTVEAVFRIYDHDNSGSIDFDEFGSWIMNSEYKGGGFNPRPPKQLPNVSKERKQPSEVLRNKLLQALSEYPTTFERLLSQNAVGYMDFMGDVNRLEMKNLTEKDVREIYLLLDPNNTSQISIQLLKTWYETGVVGRPASTLKRQEKRDVPMGKKPLPPMSAKPFTASLTDGKTNFFKSSTFLRPSTNRDLPSDMVMQVPRLPDGLGSSVTSANRRLSDCVRKEFRLLKTSVEKNANVDRLGFINSEMLYGLITKYCGTFSKADYKLALLVLKTDDTKERVDYRHFLKKYDPDNQIVAQLELYQSHLKQASHMKKTMSMGSFCGYPTPR